MRTCIFGPLDKLRYLINAIFSIFQNWTPK
jgi:hypothetical protein